MTALSVLENATLIFNVPVGEIIVGDYGEPTAQTEAKTVRCFLKQDRMPQNTPFVGGDQTVIYVKGHCTDPNVLPDGVRDGAIAKATMDGSNTEYEFHFVPAIASAGFDENEILGQKVQGYLITTSTYGSSA
jgi:hypothetical protein